MNVMTCGWVPARGGGRSVAGNNCTIVGCRSAGGDATFARRLVPARRRRGPPTVLHRLDLPRTAASNDFGQPQNATGATAPGPASGGRHPAIAIVERAVGVTVLPVAASAASR